MRRHLCFCSVCGVHGNKLHTQQMRYLYIVYTRIVNQPLYTAGSEVTLTLPRVRGREVTSASADLRERVKLPKQLVEQVDQLLSCALAGESSEADDVCKQNTAGERERRRRGGNRYRVTH